MTKNSIEKNSDAYKLAIEKNSLVQYLKTFAIKET